MVTKSLSQTVEVCTEFFVRPAKLFEAFNGDRVEQRPRSVESELEGYDTDSAVRGSIEMPGDVPMPVWGEAA